MVEMTFGSVPKVRRVQPSMIPSGVRSQRAGEDVGGLGGVRPYRDEPVRPSESALATKPAMSL